MTKIKKSNCDKTSKGILARITWHLNSTCDVLRAASCYLAMFSYTVRGFDPILKLRARPKSKFARNTLYQPKSALFCLNIDIAIKITIKINLTCAKITWRTSLWDARIPAWTENRETYIYYLDFDHCSSEVIRYGIDAEAWNGVFAYLYWQPQCLRMVWKMHKLNSRTLGTAVYSGGSQTIPIQIKESRRIQIWISLLSDPV